MLKSQILEKLNQKYNNFSSLDIENLFEIFMKKITSSLKEGKKIEIRGFGTFKKKINKEKQVRNPKNNQLLFKDKTFKLHFKTGKTLHKKLNNISSKDD